MVHLSFEEAKSVPPFCFRHVQCDIRTPDEGFYRASVPGSNRDPDASADRKFAPLNLERLGQLLKYPASELRGVLRLCRILEQDNEFIATRACDRVPLAHGGNTPLGNSVQQLIATLMPQ